MNTVRQINVPGDASGSGLGYIVDAAPAAPDQDALALIEQGAVHRRSAVLERAFSVLADLERDALQGR